MASNRITFTLNYLVALLNGSADRLLRANFSLTYSQFLFIVTLQGLGASTPSFLADRLGVSRAAVSQRLTWFEERRLIYISRAMDNQKSLSLRLTKQGAALASDSADFLEAEFRKLFFGLPNVDLDGLDKTLNQLASQLIERQEARNAA